MIRSTIDTILLEESMLTFNSELKEYWAKIIECARRKTQLTEEVDLIERRRKLLETMNSTGYHPTSKPTRLNSMRMEDGLLKRKTKQRQEIDKAYLTLFEYRRTLNSGPPTRKPLI